LAVSSSWSSIFSLLFFNIQMRTSVSRMKQDTRAFSLTQHFIVPDILNFLLLLPQSVDFSWIYYSFFQRSSDRSHLMLFCYWKTCMFRRKQSREFSRIAVTVSIEIVLQCSCNPWHSLVSLHHHSTFCSQHTSRDCVHRLLWFSDYTYQSHIVRT
jgi:hypothetical protein